MNLLIFSILLACVALLVIGLASRAQERATAARRARAAEELGKIGLQVSGDPLGAYTLRGRIGGLEVTLEAKATTKLPGASGVEREVCLLTFPVSMPDFVVCRREDQDAIMGVLPTVPQLATGHSEMDHRYAVFASADDRTGASGFRAGPEIPVLRWATGPVILQMLNFELQWARVRGGRGELAFSPVRYEGAAAALMLAPSFVTGAGASVVTRKPRGLAEEASVRSPRRAFWVVAASPPVFFGGLALLGFSSPLRDLNSEEMCGPGDRLVVIDYGDSMNVGCAGNHTRDIDIHLAGSGALSVALLFSVAAIWAATVRHHNSRLESHLRSSKGADHG